MQRLLMSFLSLAFVAGLSAGASAKPCHDAKGKFMKCKPMAMSMPMKKKPCRDKHGKFMKCKPMMGKM